ncbi:MAG: DUF2299 family protein [Thermodesulfobacteriota bacterium]
MEITTVEQASSSIKNWLDENHHQAKEIKDDAASFHFELDYPIGSLKRQRVIQPKDFPGLVVILNGVSIAEEHIAKLKALGEEERETFFAGIRDDLIFLKNSYDMNMDEEGVAKQIQFSYEFYFDSLTKSKLFEGLLLNHRTLIYIVTKFNEKFGVPVLPSAPEGQQTPTNA